MPILERYVSLRDLGYVLDHQFLERERSIQTPVADATGLREERGRSRAAFQSCCLQVNEPASSAGGRRG
jgi:hypothetical protein